MHGFNAENGLTAQYPPDFYWGIFASVQPELALLYSQWLLTLETNEAVAKHGGRQKLATSVAESLVGIKTKPEKPRSLRRKDFVTCEHPQLDDPRVNYLYDIPEDSYALAAEAATRVYQTLQELGVLNPDLSFNQSCEIDQFNWNLILDALGRAAFLIGSIHHVNDKETAWALFDTIFTIISAVEEKINGIYFDGEQQTLANDRANYIRARVLNDLAIVVSETGNGTLLYQRLQSLNLIDESGALTDPTFEKNLSKQKWFSEVLNNLTRLKIIERDYQGASSLAWHYLRWQMEIPPNSEGREKFVANAARTVLAIETLNPNAAITQTPLALDCDYPACLKINEIYFGCLDKGDINEQELEEALRHQTEWLLLETLHQEINASREEIYQLDYEKIAKLTSSLESKLASAGFIIERDGQFGFVSIGHNRLTKSCRFPDIELQLAALTRLTEIAKLKFLAEGNQNPKNLTGQIITNDLLEKQVTDILFAIYSEQHDRAIYCERRLATTYIRSLIQENQAVDYQSLVALAQELKLDLRTLLNPKFFNPTNDLERAVENLRMTCARAGLTATNPRMERFLRRVTRLLAASLQDKTILPVQTWEKLTEVFYKDKPQGLFLLECDRPHSFSSSPIDQAQLISLVGEFNGQRIQTATRLDSMIFAGLVNSVPNIESRKLVHTYIKQSIAALADTDTFHLTDPTVSEDSNFVIKNPNDCHILLENNQIKFYFPHTLTDGMPALKWLEGFTTFLKEKGWQFTATANQTAEEPSQTSDHQPNLETSSFGDEAIIATAHDYEYLFAQIDDEGKKATMKKKLPFLITLASQLTLNELLVDFELPIPAATLPVAAAETRLHNLNYVPGKKILQAILNEKDIDPSLLQTLIAEEETFFRLQVTLYQTQHMPSAYRIAAALGFLPTVQKVVPVFTSILARHETALTNKSIVVSIVKTNHKEINHFVTCPSNTETGPYAGSSLGFGVLIGPKSIKYTLRLTDNSAFSYLPAVARGRLRSGFFTTFDKHLKKLIASC